MNSPEALRWKSIVWLLALSATLSQTAVSSSDGNLVCPEGYRAVAAPGYDSLHTSFHHLVPGRALACGELPLYWLLACFRAEQNAASLPLEVHVSFCWLTIDVQACPAVAP